MYLEIPEYRNTFVYLGYKSGTNHNHIKRHNLFLCNHIIHNMQSFNISCYWHIRKYFYQRFDNFMKADNEWGKLCNNLSLKRIHNIHS